MASEEPEDQQEDNPPSPDKQIVTIRPVRDYISEKAREENQQVSQYMRESIFPEEWETVSHGYGDDEVVRIKVTEEVNSIVDRMTGGRVDKGEVVALYVLIDALRAGDEQTAKEIFEYIPEILWDRMEGRS